MGNPHSMISRFWGIENFFMDNRGGGCHVLPSNFLSQYQKLSLESTSVYQIVPGIENFYA